jgi:hypothetical protein
MPLILALLWRFRCGITFHHRAKGASLDPCTNLALPLINCMQGSIQMRTRVRFSVHVLGPPAHVSGSPLPLGAARLDSSRAHHPLWAVAIHQAAPSPFPGRGKHTVYSSHVP